MDEGTVLLTRSDRDMARTLMNVDHVPGVIDMDMIREEVVKIVGNDLVGQTFKAFYTIECIEKIYLERLSILRIDNLWMLKRLQILSLSNNLIEKIENLDVIPTLVELNLSFNRIMKIENLEALENLERLSLYNNKIKIVENLHQLTKLKILSLGDNLIEQKECVLYLRKMESLQSLNLKGNPCALEINFRQYVALFCPNIHFLDYIIIKGKDRIQGRKLFEADYETMKEEERVQREEIRKSEAIEERKSLLAASYVEDLEGSELYQTMMESDPDGQTILLLEEKINDIFNVLKKDLTTVSRVIFKMGQVEFKKRSAEHDTFLAVIEECRETGINQSREVVKEFEQVEDKFIQYMGKVVKDFDKSNKMAQRLVRLTDIMSQYGGNCDTYWLALVGREVFLHDQLEDLIAQFEVRMGEMVSHFVENVKSSFTQMRDAEMNYFEMLSDRMLRFLAQISSKEMNVLVLPTEILPILKDKETVNNCVGTSHDSHLLAIDTAEDKIITGITNWFKETLNKYSQDEVQRHRAGILEIINYLERKKQGFNKRLLTQLEHCQEIYEDAKQACIANIQNFGAKLLGHHREQRSSTLLGDEDDSDQEGEEEETQDEGEKKKSMTLEDLARSKLLEKKKKKKQPRRVVIMLPTEREIGHKMSITNDQEEEMTEVSPSAEQLDSPRYSQEKPVTPGEIE